MERRHTRRLARYWVFIAIAYLFGLGGYFYYSTLHALFSSISASVGMVGPRYLMGAIGLYYLTGFVLGIVFLGFDIRARDVRDGIVEVLDSRPITNLELVAGKFIALFLSAWLPIVILVVLIQAFGWLLPLLGSPVGRTVEPLSLFNFVIYMAVPALSFAIGLVFVITLLVRHRLIAALLTVGAVIGLYWLLFTVPGPYATFFDYLGVVQQQFPSDIVPAVSITGGFLQRFGVLLLGLGLVGLAAAVHPRIDGQTRSRPALASGALVAAGLAGIAVVVQMRLAEVATLDRWLSAHEARSGEPVADIQSIDGSISIDPGRQLDADLNIELTAPDDAGLNQLLFTLNPGLEIDAITDQDGNALATTHADGLLDVTLGAPLAPGEGMTINLRYSGLPHEGFGYLDSVITPEKLNLNEAQLVLLGYERGIFDSRYVALPSGVRWLPAAGADTGRDDQRQRRADYFSIELDVEVPSGWLAAAPGKREDLGTTAESARFRFSPNVPVPEFALMASQFEQVATEIRGITFEVLVHPEHADNFEVLADARSEIEDWVNVRLEVAENAGLEYPFDAFTVVEVPNTLRSFEGGWRLDSALAPPGMMLLRETSFPTARFDFDVIAVFGNRDYDQDGGAPRIDRNRLVSFFSNDFSGGNIFAGAARSFFSHRTSAFGPDAIALDYVLEELSTMLVSGRRSYFSAHLFTNINQAVNSIVGSLQGEGIDSVLSAVISGRTSRTDVWNSVLQRPLSEVDPWEDPQRTIDMLALKGGAMAEAIRDTLGPDNAIALFGLMLERHAGGTFSLADLVAAGGVVSDQLPPLLNDWISGTGLPGFVVRGVEQYRLPEDESGNARYQLLVRLSNDEPVVGFARINWTVADTGPQQGFSVSIGSGGAVAERISIASSVSDPIRIPGRSAIEFGVVLNLPVTRVTVRPYLSLNRDPFIAGDLNTGADAIPTQAVATFEGVREIPFVFDEGERIIADDLDESFSIVTEEGEQTFRLVARENVQLDLDQGLPVATGIAPSDWSRRSLVTSYGRYRHTLAYIGAGDGLSRAVMPVEIPEPGLWELEIHVPPYFSNFRQTWNLEIVSANGREAVSYDASLSTNGWNLVGQFQLPAGQVSVEISDRTDGRLVIADAIGWSPITNRNQSQESTAQ